MIGRALIFHRYRNRTLLPALFALVGFQIVFLGMAGGDQPRFSGRVISQKSRNCALVIPSSRESVFEKSFFKDAR